MVILSRCDRATIAATPIDFRPWQTPRAANSSCGHFCKTPVSRSVDVQSLDRNSLREIEEIIETARIREDTVEFALVFDV